MEYDEEFIQSAFSYLYNYEKLNLDTSKIHLLSKKEQEIVNKVYKIYQNITVYKDRKEISVEPVDFEDAINCTNYLLANIFDKRIDQILEMDKITSYEDINYGSSGIYYNLINGKPVVNEILLPNEYNGYYMSTIAHEKTHVLTFQNLDIIDLFTTGLEIFPVLIQKIIIYELETEYDFSYISEFDQIVRLIDCRKGLNILNSFNKIEPNNLSKLDKYLKEYTRINAIDYLKAELFSELLLEKYKFNRYEMIENLNKLFDKKISSEQFLNMYDANLLNKDLIPLVKQNASKIKRISIIP